MKTRTSVERSRAWRACCPLGLVAACGLAACRHEGPPFSPGESARRFRIETGFTIELVAAEPLVASPVAVDFDEHGRLFVAEMPGYPLDTRPTGRIRLLEDRDDDGRFETSRVFADGMVLPTGVMRYRDGVLVTAAPDVWYLADADGDGRAERREKVLTGFAFSNPQHTVNSPVYGLDNWIYLAHEGPAGAVVYKELFGDPGSAIRFPDRPGSKPLAQSRNGVRFRIDTAELEALAGSSQFGHSFDEWGRHFTLDNSNHLRHEVLAARYLARNPQLAVGRTMQNVSDHGSNATVYAITHRPRFELLTEPGEFTSACGLLFYTGGALDPRLGRTSFVAEPAQNLVHRDVFRESGASFRAARAHEGVEFLASTDSWFRPVNLSVGPDGAIYLVDYYREMIEHPEWASSHEHAHEHGAPAGQDRGRLWRIAPSAAPLERERPSLAGASDAELSARLAHSNSWWRRTAQRLLVERRRVDAAPLLVALARGDSPLGRLHALWTLEGLGRLDDALLEQALRDPEPGVRENALRLAEPRLARSPVLVAAALRLQGDESARVRFQLLATIGGVESKAARAVHERLLHQDLEDEWVAVAALSASARRAAELVDAALAPGSAVVAGPTPGRASFLARAGEMVGAGGDEAQLARALRAVAQARGPAADWWRAALVDGLAQGARRSGRPLAEASEPVLAALAFDRATGVRRAALKLLALAPPRERLAPRTEAAAAIAVDAGAPADRRADAVRLLALVDAPARLGLFVRLFDSGEPEEVQAAAAGALARVPGEAAGRPLIERWPRFTAPVRSEAAEALLADPARTRMLVAALRDGRVPAWSLSFSQKRDLIMHDDPEIRAEARPLLESRPAERARVLKRYQAALDQPGDARRGAKVFSESCARCHRLNGEGASIGPDLGSLRHRAPQLLLADILDPSRAIAQGYEAYVVETASGETLTGVLAAQNPTAITLRREGAEERVVPRAEIRELRVSELSAMPNDLELLLDVQSMADLIAHLTAQPPAAQRP